MVGSFCFFENRDVVYFRGERDRVYGGECEDVLVGV